MLQNNQKKIIKINNKYTKSHKQMDLVRNCYEHGHNTEQQLSYSDFCHSVF